MMRRTWTDRQDTVALTWQCALAGLSRSAVYARQKPKLIALDDEMLKRLIDEEYTRHPFYGSRKGGGVPGALRPQRQPQTGPASDAHAGPGG
jgi:hypothetical protein